MGNAELSETGQQFLIRLFEQTHGDQSKQVSMYEIGDLLDLERNAASKVAEELIGLEMVEIKTLSGGIGISAAGSEMVQNLIGPLVSNAGEPAKLGDGPLLNSAGRSAIEQMAAEIKGQISTLGLDYDSLTELMADLKSIETQLGSPRPKTAIVKACLYSICALVKGTPNKGLYGQVCGMLGD